MKKINLYLFVSLIILGCNAEKTQKPELKNLAKFVDPMIGTDGSGHTFPGATTPFGFVQLSPDTDLGNWKRCSGYHYSDSTIVGFSHTHISGSGATDLGDFLFQPTIGKVIFDRGLSSKPDSGYRSRFDRKDEFASAGYYSVVLKDYNIKAEMTATPRVGIHKYTFPQSDSANIIIDLTNNLYSWKKPENVWNRVWVEDSVTISGFKISSGWAKERYMFFTAKFSKPFNSHVIKTNLWESEETNYVNKKDIKIALRFKTEKGESIIVKVAISPVSINNAKLNLEEETNGFDFDFYKKMAENLWNKELNKIIIEGSDEDKTKFYTSLYHSMIAPNLYQDVNGQYRGADLGIYENKNFTNYTLFSLWDTYRALHPLLTIIDTKRSSDFVNSMIAHYKENPYKILPIWSFHGNETFTMIGYHSVPVITDAFLKGIKGFNPDSALSAIVNSAKTAWYDGLGDYMKIGYVPIDKEKEAAARTLEFAFDDWAIAEMAKKMDKTDLYDEFFKRSKNYKNLFDYNTNFIRAKNSEGNWETRNPTGVFDPFFAKYGHDFTEGNSWQYSWYVPHDVYTYMDMFGGKDIFVSKLDSLFKLDSDIGNHGVHDISGLIGQYAHGNEPSHHVAYLYQYAGIPEKSAEIVNEIKDSLYTLGPNGLCGNDDCGQMSAWYVFSSLGFYPVNPSSGVYVISTPSFSKSVINLENGKSFEIIAKNVSKENIYIGKCFLNGEEITRSWISHKEIMSGGKIVFEMVDSPTNWGINKKDLPPNSSY